MVQPVQRPVVTNRVLLSLSLSLKITKFREELAKVEVASVVSGFVNGSSILELLPSLVNRSLAGPLIPVNDSTFLVPLESREEVKEVCKLGSFKVNTKDGNCILKMAPWSAELGAKGKASGAGQWVLIWNLPCMDGVGVS